MARPGRRGSWPACPGPPPGAVRTLFAAVVRARRARPDQALGRFAALLAEPDARLHIVDGGGTLLLSHLDQILASVTSPGQ